MAWDFETDPEFQKKLDWIEEFMMDKVEPLSNLGRAMMVPGARDKFIKPMQDEVRRRRACGPATSVPNSAARAMASSSWA